MPRYVPACCMFCHDKGRPHEFEVRLGKGQRYHGCVEGKSFSAKQGMAKRNLSAERRKADFTRRNKERKEVKIKVNRKLCPICGVIWTVNYYACKQCHERLAHFNDIDGMITFQQGLAHHIKTRGGAWAT
jgi:hypothetical protein